MKVLGVSSWGGACGIANYLQMAKEAIERADPDIVIVPSPESLDPAHAVQVFGEGWEPYPDVIWLNYHRGLHSRWTPGVIEDFKDQTRVKVVITHHDSVGEAPPDALTQQLHDLADAFVVHEPCEGLPKQILIRQGVPAPSPGGGVQYPFDGRPILGTAGFNFPWKNFDRLAEVTAGAGWAYVVCSNNATDADERRWTKANPHTVVLSGFRPTAAIVSQLTGCDATCWPYECANSGTSGAIRLGIAARKPVIAFRGCRQFRDLWLSDGGTQIHWPQDWADLSHRLLELPIQRVDPGIAYLAHRDSWVHQGQRYADIFRSLAA